MIRYVTIFALVTLSSPASAGEYEDMANFAQSICGDIPSGSLTKSAVRGAVKANAGLLARLISGGVTADAEVEKQVYEGIPLDKLPDNIPTVSMCKTELVKVLLARKKIVANTCRHPDFGQEGWKMAQDVSNSSGRVGGGHDQNWWCNELATSFISSRNIGPHNNVERVSSREESHKDWKGHVEYKYHCSLRISWDPLYVEKKDASHCGTHEE